MPGAFLPLILLSFISRSHHHLVLYLLVDCDSLGKGPFPTGLFYGFPTHLVKRFLPHPRRKSQIKKWKVFTLPLGSPCSCVGERVGFPQTRQLVSLFEKERTLSLLHLCQIKTFLKLTRVWSPGPHELKARLWDVLGPQSELAAKAHSDSIFLMVLLVIILLSFINQCPVSLQGY